MSEEWIVLEPRRGKRPEEKARVTLAWRMTNTTGPMTGYVNVAKAVMTRLGWDASGKVEVAHDACHAQAAVELLHAAATARAVEHVECRSYVRPSLRPVDAGRAP